MNAGTLRLRVAALLLVAASLPASGLEVLLRDSVSGAPLDARLELAQQPSSAAPEAALPAQRVTMDIVEGRGEVVLRTGRWRYDVICAQHAPLDAVMVIDGSSPSLTVLLDPLRDPQPVVATRNRAAQDPTRAFVHGYVRDASSALAVANAVVRVDAGGATTRTDRDGYFVLDAGIASDVGVPRTVLVDAIGYARAQRRDEILAAGATQLLLLLDAQPRLLRAEHRPLLSRDPREDASVAPDARAPVVSALPVLLAPPATIRVGFNDAGCTATCCGTSCSNTCTMSLETYVKRGLDSEWIASWNTQSLRAGSLAYRAYGAWHVLHPRTPNYDICSSACCQVNDASTAASTDAAAARTPGMLLTRDGIEAYRAEFSAENNSWDDPGDGLSCSNVDLSCGNGFAGSPSAGWPCLSDTVGATHGCFGHGRGMSQWGTQRWAIHPATPKSWKWITNHYYNDNANESGVGSGQRTATMTSPLSLTSLVATPTSVSAGSSFAIQVGVDNRAGASHSHLLIGASLYKSGIGYISDPSGDAALVALSGSGSGSRAFAVPAATATGIYDLIVALYLDVDENGLISSDDLAMNSTTRIAYISVGNDRIYASGFEP
ncbi:MAG: SpoIID/LytB domain-containing protein [Tahibacter sp.]